MIPDTLAHIVQDVKIGDIQQKIDKYKMKLAAFKAKTELKDMIGLQFPVPDSHPPTPKQEPKPIGKLLIMRSYMHVQ